MKSVYLSITALFLCVPTLAMAQNSSTSTALLDIDPSAEALEYGPRNHIIPVGKEELNNDSDDENQGRHPSNDNTLFRGSHTAMGTLEQTTNNLTTNNLTTNNLTTDAQPVTQKQSSTPPKTIPPQASNDTANTLVKIEELYLRSLKIREKNLGPDHLEVAATLNNLADFYKENDQAIKAQKLYQRALGILEKNLGPDHPSVASTLENLANVYRRTSAQKMAKSIP